MLGIFNPLELTMIRDIKFRVWNSYSKKVLSCDQIQFGVGNLVSVSVDYDIFEVPRDCIMQYTGLKDKNSKEIYEGDILKSKALNEWGEYEECVIQVKDIRKFYFRTMQLQLNDREQKVIGNIYENPELLAFRDLEYD